MGLCGPLAALRVWKKQNVGLCGPRAALNMTAPLNFISQRGNFRKIPCQLLPSRTAAARGETIHAFQINYLSRNVSRRRLGRASPSGIYRPKMFDLFPPPSSPKSSQQITATFALYSPRPACLRSLQASVSSCKEHCSSFCAFSIP